MYIPHTISLWVTETQRSVILSLRFKSLFSSGYFKWITFNCTVTAPCKSVKHRMQIKRREPDGLENLMGNIWQFLWVNKQFPSSLVSGLWSKQGELRHSAKDKPEEALLEPRLGRDEWEPPRPFTSSLWILLARCGNKSFSYLSQLDSLKNCCSLWC